MNAGAIAPAGCNLTKADLARARGVHVDPAKSRIKGLRINAETAASIARAFGMVVV